MGFGQVTTERHAPLTRSQMRTVASADAEAKRHSGSRSMAITCSFVSAAYQPYTGISIATERMAGRTEAAKK